MGKVPAWTVLGEHRWYDAYLKRGDINIILCGFSNSRSRPGGRGLKVSTSARMMRPSGPVPLTWTRGIPRSRAIFFATGLAKMRSPTGSSAAVSAGLDWGGGRDGKVSCLVAQEPFLASEALALMPALRERPHPKGHHPPPQQLQSLNQPEHPWSPQESATNQSHEYTGKKRKLTMILARIPSSWASTSMVALSVSCTAVSQHRKIWI